MLSPDGPTNEFDYRHIVTRTDLAHPPLASDAPATTLDTTGLASGRASDVLACVLGVWRQFSLPPSAIAMMGGIMNGLLHQLSQTSTSLYEAKDDIVDQFLMQKASGQRRVTPQQVHLRRNTINGAYLALEDAGVIEPAAPFALPEGLADKRRGRHVRAATHDEVLITRLATRLSRTQRRRYLAAACVALCSNTAEASEAPQVRWTHHTGDGLKLEGRVSLNHRPGMNIASRTVELDPWARAALDAWRTECAAARHIHPEDSMIYTGTQALTSNSAAVSADNQVNKR